MSELRRITERYLPEEQIASDPRGSLFRGSDLQTGEKVAIRLIHAADESEAQRRRFLEAARGLQSVHSPGFPRLLDFGFTHAGSAFLVTPHLQGSGLEALHALLEAVLRSDPEEPDVVAAPEPEPEPELPPPVAPPPPPPAKRTARRSRLSPRVGVPAAVLLLVGTACGLVFLPRWTPEPPRPFRPTPVTKPAPPPVASKPTAPAPVPPPKPEAPPPEPAPRIELRVAPSKPRPAPILPKTREADAVFPARFDRLAAERKEDQDLETLVTAAAQYETYRRPLEGLRLLASATPNERYAGRFQETRRRLEAQFAQLDRRPPVVLLRAGGTPLYEKGKTGTVPLRIFDDQVVGSVEGWARPEGGTFVKVAVRHLSGQGYAMEVPPEVHRNGTAEFYVVATDLSGHTGQLGSPENPLKLKRMTWLEKIQGMRERPERKG